MKMLKRNALPMAVVVFTVVATNAPGSTLTLIPIPSWLSGTTDNQGRAITPDGKYVVGVSGASSQGGYLYDVVNNLVIQPTNSAGDVPSTATGVAYRTDPVGSQKQLIIDGLSAGVQANWMTSDGGATWGATRRDAAFVPATSSGYNTLGAAAGSDAFYAIIRNSTSKELYVNQGSNHWDSATPPSFMHDFLALGVDNGAMNGVTPTGRAVGHRKINASGARLNYLIDFPASAATGFYFNGLAGTSEGEAFAVSADGNTVFGRSPNTPAGADLYGYKVVNPGISQTITALPEFGDTGGSTSRCVPYGCTADGKLACGMNYRVNAEKACLWDTSDADTNNWIITDLTDRATAEGILGSFTSLSRAYSVGTNAAGYPVITGIGTAGGFTRAFVMVLSPAAPSVTQPRITSITGTGTGSVTVNYTNTLVGTNYTLQYRTNFSTTNWDTVGSQTASGTSDSQTDASATADQRYYRVYYSN